MQRSVSLKRGRGIDFLYLHVKSIDKEFPVAESFGGGCQEVWDIPVLDAAGYEPFNDNIKRE